MPKFKYTGKSDHILAGVGPLTPDQVFTVTEAQADALSSAPEYEPVVAAPADSDVKTSPPPAVPPKDKPAVPPPAPKAK